jgi:hypothetical protein
MESNNQIYSYFGQNSTDEQKSRSHSFSITETPLRLDYAPKLKPKVSLVEPTPINLNSYRGSGEYNLDGSEYAETACSVENEPCVFVTKSRSILKHMKSRVDVNIVDDEVYVEFE